MKVFILRNAQIAANLWAELKGWPEVAETDSPLMVTVEAYRDTRSKDQNKRYWALLNEISEQASIGGKRYSSAVLHEWFKASFIGMEESPDGRLIALASRELKKDEFTAYMNRVEVYAATELGVVFSC